MTIAAVVVMIMMMIFAAYLCWMKIPPQWNVSGKQIPPETRRALAKDQIPGPQHGQRHHRETEAAPPSVGKVTDDLFIHLFIY